MSFLKEFKNSGYFYQCTDYDQLNHKMQNQKITAYIGFDCTAQSLHVGNLMQIMILRLLQKYGHKPIILVGGATTKIGDPSGKEESRQYLSDQEIERNILGIKKSLSKFIHFGTGESDAIILNNSNWLESLGYIDVLRDIGKHFSINRMITMDSVKSRLQRQQSLTFLEFNYMLLQAYDFYYLNKNYDCSLQLGGSDQWGNIVMGVDLIHKISNSKDAFGLTTPLLTTSSGVKMGKSVSGAIWINEELLSPYEYYQYWRNTEDTDVIKFAKLYCEFSQQELLDFTNLAHENINEAKQQLAYSVTSICHGVEEADKALATSINVFKNNNIGDALPEYLVDAERISAGIVCCDLLVESDLVKSKSEARRLIRSNGVKINGEKILDENLQITLEFLKNNAIKLSVGRKKHIVIKVISQ